MWRLGMVIASLVLRGGKGQSLSCYTCGKLSVELNMMEECTTTTTTTITTCKEGEACVTYIKNDKERSAPIQGCFPLNSSLPFLGPAPLLSSPVCEMRDVGTVSFCICTSSGCNDQGDSLEKSRQQQRQPRDAASREPKNFIFPFANSSTVTKTESREGRQRRLKCYSCGSLFNRDSPQCAEFNPGNGNQVMTCNEGEACMLYTWKKSRTEIGSYRECFSTSILLGHPDYPITPRPTCSLSRTQQDTRSSIRACLCTQDFCNNVQDVILRNLWTEDNPANSLPSTQSDDFQPVLNDQGGVKKVEGEVKVQLGQPPVTCPVVKVTNADFADCNGDYSVTEERVAWAADRPVYAHAEKDRFIFWNAGGLGWSIGKRDYLSSGSHWHRSGLDSKEPWQGEWEDGVQVNCKGGDCVWSGYSVWSGCDVSCGVGRQVRNRRIRQAAREGGKDCVGSAKETRACQSAPCPVDCKWANYGAWSTCSQTCGGGTRTRRRRIAKKSQAGGRDCKGDGEEVKFCQTQACPEAAGSAEGDDISGSCCQQVRVGSTGNARIDQALYMGIYTRLARDFNGRAVYKREGQDPLYIYYFTSQRDQLSLWVIGPQLGQFIAGIRNSKAGNCVHDLQTGWKYASRAGVWEDNDPSLTVKCQNTVPSRSAQPTSQKKKISDVIDQVFTETTQSPAKAKRKNCVWSRYGEWSECSESCGGGEQVRIRRVQQQETGGGRPCRGGNRERRRCNQVSCPIKFTTTTETVPSNTQGTTTRSTTTRKTTTRRTTTRRTTTRRTTTRRTTTRRTTTRRATTKRPVQKTTKVPKPQNSQVQCWVCGSLFSTDAPDCPQFNKQDPKQLKTCDVGEACLYYSWKKSNTDVSVIRECFPTSILLGSIDDPVEPLEECTPVSVESDTINACICTSDFCNGIGDDDIDISPSLVPNERRQSQTTTNRPRIATTTRGRQPKPARSSLDRVQCHQCGSLFSSASNNPNCDVFDESDPLQQNYCQPGEACLWYSWQKSRSSTSFIRECFSTSILLGSIDDPLETKSFCDPQDISDGPQSKITACLCDSDLCNSYRGSGEKRPEFLAVHTLTQNDPIPLRSSGKRPTLVREEETTRNRDKTPRKIDSVIQQTSEPQERSKSSAKQSFHPDEAGLQCYSCGSLLNPNKKCETFDREDKTQVQTCLKDEACLMYSWKKSSTQTATLRECFPTRVLLGSIQDPLVPLPDCSQRDITDEGSGSIFACLCNTDFCNDEKNAIGQTSNSNDRKAQQKTTRRPQSTRRTNPTTRRTVPTTQRTFPPRRNINTTRPPPSKIGRQQEIRSSCPQDFDLVDGGCYFISNERVGWIEARKNCQQREAILLSIETRSEKQKVVEYVSSSTRRRRSEYWLAGNDIEEEGVWEWARRSTPVPDFGWTEDPFNSYEENCLAWTVTINGAKDSRDGWHGSSCCNNLRYICEL